MLLDVGTKNLIINLITMAESKLKGKKCLVTGVAGFIGSHLADRLLELGAEVYGIDNFYTGFSKNIPEGVKFTELDFSRAEALHEYFDVIRPEYVFHVGAWSRMPMCLDDPQGAYNGNVIGSLNVLEESKKYGVKKVVLSSSCIVYCEETPYKSSKVAMEDIARVYRKMYELPTACLRYANVYGTRQEVGSDSAMFAMLKDTYKREGHVNIFGDGEQTRDWIHVDDVCRANIHFMESDFEGEIDIATGNSISLNYIIDVLGVKAKYMEERKGDAKHIKLNPEPAKKLGYEATINFEDGIKNVWENL
jgi:UDP-glucose 4-epimerase